MQRLLLIFIAILLITVSAEAQRRPGGGFQNQVTPEERVSKQVKALEEPLMLDNVQMKLMEITMMKNQKKITELMQNIDLSREQKRDSVQKLYQIQNDEIQNLLTEEQFEVYQQIEKENREKRAKEFRGKRPNQN
ncbi:MAG: hypothetical protein CO119_08585 [Flavobacteriales bacterium CG_4_9_14_3_um_filter_40_17]|nr:MAG: hypothetical protein CO119_08585 [Flavobacteriales bacterium CG_4_9_14_3_um_filter_40_17]